MTKPAGLVLILFGFLPAAIACADRTTASSGASVFDAMAAAPGPAAPAGADPPAPVAPPAGAIAAKIDGVPPFFVRTRGGELTKAPCAGCHTVPLAAMRWHGRDGRARAHWDVEFQHAPASVMACTTCHAAGNLDVLRTLAGEAVPFDHAYQVCAQCHATMARDWAGGAHGKRASGWADPRVVFNCAGCHDPHRPALPTRWPAHAGRSER